MIGKEKFLTIEEEASHTFVQHLHGKWTPIDQHELEARLERDSAYADAYRRVEESWSALDTHAETPEIMVYREEAIAYARRSNARRWLKSTPYMRGRWRMAAAFVCCLLALAMVWQLSPYGYKPGQYHTGIGEQRIVELDDHSRIALDAATRLQVRFSRDARIVELKEGQAQFSVAHDPTRPFEVQAGEQTIVALGTVFTVEYIDSKVHVAMMEGRVAVAHRWENEGATRRDVELSAGEELRVNPDGRATVTHNADLEAATAWREGKVIFRTEPLGEAVRRVNRYSRMQIELDDGALASQRISGVFEAGDTLGFVSAIQRYLPVTVDYANAKMIRLKAK